MSSSLVSGATRAAILSSGLYTMLVSTPVDGDGYVSPGSWARPGPSTVGTKVTDTITTFVGVNPHRDSMGRTVYLVLDPDTFDELSGENLTVTIDGDTATVVESVSLLSTLTAFAAAINSDIAGVTATVVATDPSGVANAVRITADPSAAIPETGIPEGATYRTFAVQSASAGEDSALELWRELDGASFDVWLRPNYRPGSTTDTALAGSSVASAMDGGWHKTSSFLAADGGFAENFNVSSADAVHIQLHTPVSTDSAFTIATGIAGLYAVRNVVYVAVAKAVESA